MNYTIPRKPVIRLSKLSAYLYIRMTLTPKPLPENPTRGPIHFFWGFGSHGIAGPAEWGWDAPACICQSRARDREWTRKRRATRLVGCIATTPAAIATTAIAATEATAAAPTTTAPSTTPVHAGQIGTLRSDLFDSFISVVAQKGRI